MRTSRIELARSVPLEVESQFYSSFCYYIGSDDGSPPRGGSRSKMRQSAGGGATFFYELDGYHPGSQSGRQGGPPPEPQPARDSTQLANRRSFYKQCSLAGGSLVLRLVARSLDPGAAQLSLCANGDRGRLRVRMRNLRHLIGLVIEIDIHWDIPVRATLLLLAVLPYVGLGLLLLRWHAGGIYDRPSRRWQHVRCAEPARIDLRIHERNAIVREGVLAAVHGRNAAAAATTKQLLWVGAPGATKCR